MEMDAIPHDNAYLPHSNATLIHEYSTVTDTGTGIFFMERLLGGGGGDDLVIDYTVLAMAVVTMALLLVVAVIRHRIDHMARGKEYFEDVLEAVYHELSTLGIVEATVFIIHHYFKINLAVERVFAEVHFTLFFVAIINAIMNSLLYFFSSQVAHHQWVRMEAIDLDHYVAVRRQFDAVEEQLRLMKEAERRRKDEKARSKSRGRDGGDSGQPMRGRTVRFQGESDHNHYDTHNNDHDHQPWNETSAMGAMYRSSPYDWLKSNFKQIIDTKHRGLMVQVRFHEMRVHFIEVNNLDPKFKVSQYLKLCMNDVFKRQVEISSSAWLVLLGCTILVYFCLGVVASQIQNQESIGKAFSWIYIGYVVAFVLISFWLAGVMKRIFFKIMEHQKWINTENGSILRRQQSMSQFSSASLPEESEGTRQVDYFPGGHPKYIVVALQAMQFGYALALAILLVFSKTMKSSDSPIRWFGFYVIVPLLCYLLFLWLWSWIIPRYTQCTSLGELVNRKNLNNAEAMFQLKEARHHRQDEIDYAETERAIEENMKTRTKEKVKVKVEIDESSNSKLGFLSRILPGAAESGNKNGQKKDQLNYLDLSISGHSLTGSQRLSQITELVKKPATELPEVRQRRRSARKKSVSDGVAAMRLFSTTSAVASEALMNSEMDNEPQPAPPLPSKPRTRPRRQKAHSTGVFFMQSEMPKSMFFEPEISQQVEQAGGENEIKMGATNNNSHATHDTMPKSLQQKKFIMPISEGTEGSDRGLSEKAENDDDDFSEGLPEIADTGSIEDVAEEKVPLDVRLCQIFLTHKWRRSSAVCGTFVIFFLIAVRIEVILIETCTIKDNLNTWDFFPRTRTFWIIVVWFCLFIIESSLGVVLFLKTKMSPSMVIAGCYDIVLSIICLAMFLKAEANRCCECEGSTTIKYHSNVFLGYHQRLLGSEDTAYDSSCDPYHDCCPTFGARLCGGVGFLEPLASIIVFRLIRFSLAKKVHKMCCPATPQQGASSNEETSIGDSQMVQSIDDSKKKASEKCDFEHDVGTIAQLWTLAVAKYPHIVEEHGMFSGLLLEAMLGVAPTSAPNTEALSSINTGVKRLLRRAASDTPDTPASLRKSLHKSISNAGSETKSERNDDNDHNFIRPASTLVRRMRRCQCKWLPLLDSWEVVDVVLTKYELVWFGPQSIGGLWDEHIDRKKDEIHGSLRANKGGKGMRLCDVAVGRELLGRMPLADIDQIKVHRSPSGSSRSLKRKKSRRDVESGTSDNEDFLSEFWSDGPETAEGPFGSPGERWNAVTEDVLVLHSPQGVLYLRFLVDLLGEENIDVKDKVDIHDFSRKSEGALLWCQTISHVCGASQLKKQKLPNFGEPNELSDFVEIGEARKMKKNIVSDFMNISAR